MKRFIFVLLFCCAMNANAVRKYIEVVGLEEDLAHMDDVLNEQEMSSVSRAVTVDDLVSDIDSYEADIDSISANIASDFDKLMETFEAQFDNSGVLDPNFVSQVDLSTTNINAFLELTRARTFSNSYTGSSMAMAMAHAMAMAMAMAMANAMAMA